MSQKKVNKRELGKLGEDIAFNFLQNNGIKIIKRNYLTKFGEIDLIGIEKKTIIFIEVKLRNSLEFGFPFESVNFRKKMKLSNSINFFLSQSNIDYDECRFDVISIIFDSKDLYKIEWLKNQDFY